MAHTDRETVPGRPPAPALLVAGVMGLQALALAALAVEALTHLGRGGLSTGAELFLAGVYAVVAVWIGVSGAGVLRGRAWSRGAAVAVQLFGVLLAMWLLSLGARVLGGVLLVLSGAALIAVFTRAVSAHLGGAAR